MWRRQLARVQLIAISCFVCISSRSLSQPGNLEANFNPSANDHVYSIVALPDGKLVVGGWFWGIAGSFQAYVVRLLNDGTVDPGFASPFPALSSGPVTSMAIQNGGEVIIAGQLALAGFPGHAVMRLFQDGKLDTNFVVTTDQFFFPNAVALLPNGKVVVATYETGNPPVTRLNADGSRDTSFAPALGGGGLAVTALSDGRCIVGGTFGLVRLNDDGSQDSFFGNPANGLVAAIVPLSDGRLLLAGDFGSIGAVPRARVARLTSDGRLDASFDPGTGPDALVSALAVQADGKVVIGGSFTTVAGTSRNHIARLKENGQLDTEFDPGAGADHEVRALAIQPDGKAVIGGLFGGVEGQTRSHIARLTADGSVNPGFVEFSTPQLTVSESVGTAEVGLRRFSGHSGAVTLRVSSNSGGAVTNEDYIYDSAVVTFADGETNKTIVIPIVSDNAIEPVETFYLALGEPTGGVTIAQANQSAVTIIDDDYGVHFAVSEIQTHELSGSTRISVVRAGLGSGAFTVQYLCEAETARDGEDYTGVSGTLAFAEQDAVQYIDVPVIDDKLREGVETFLVRLLNVSPPASLASPQTVRVRLNDNDLPGGIVPTFRPNLTAALTQFAVQSDGAVIVKTNAATNLIRFLPDGNRDMAYVTPRASYTDVFTVDASNRLVYVTVAGFGGTNGIGRLLSSGSLDTSFKTNAGVIGTVDSFLELPDHSILLSGLFSRVNGEIRRSLARLHENGEVATNFNLTFGPNPSSARVYALALQPDGGVLVGGSFGSVDGVARRSLARLDSSGALDMNFLTAPSAGTLQRVYAVGLQPDGSVLVGGDFTIWSGLNRQHLVRLDSQGKLDTNFARAGPFLSSQVGVTAVEGILVQANGRILIRGAFTQVLGVPRLGIARLLADGTLDPEFDPVVADRSPSLDIRAMAFAPGGRILVGGRFTSVASLPWNHLVLLYTEYPESLQARIQTLTGLPAGPVTIHFTTSSRARFTLQRSEDLQAWTDVVETGEIDVEGEVQDTAAHAAVRFYRLLETQ